LLPAIDCVVARSRPLWPRVRSFLIVPPPLGRLDDFVVIKKGSPFLMSSLPFSQFSGSKPLPFFFVVGSKDYGPTARTGFLFGSPCSVESLLPPPPWTSVEQGELAVILSSRSFNRPVQFENKVMNPTRVEETGSLFIFGLLGLNPCLGFAYVQSWCLLARNSACGSPLN